MKLGRTLGLLATAGVAALALAATSSSALAQDGKPNIIVIMGDDVGWENIGAYHQGLMYDTTPNLDKLASEGMRFTDYYAEPSCTAGRANFITGRIADPHRPHHGRPGGRKGRHARRRSDDRHRAEDAWAMKPASSARTISAI